MLLFLVLFIVYQISANHIFTNMLRVEGEARRARHEVPTSVTEGLRARIDSALYLRREWKDTIEIRGWAFKEGADRSHYDAYIILESEIRVYVYNTSLYIRMDIPQHFGEQISKNLSQSGFSAAIPLDAIDDGTYRVGILLRNRYTGEVYYNPGSITRSLLIRGTTVEFPVDATDVLY